MDWHSRYLQQAAWTRDLRSYLFEKAGLSAGMRVLEVGCGTGAILGDLSTPVKLHGLDIAFTVLGQAKQHVPAAALACGDALSLPYDSHIFDVVFCHFLLLWVADPLQALREMRRVTRPFGSILACAEPDYTYRVDEPQALQELGCLQTEALRSQGADPSLGGHLSELFSQAGIPLIESGVLQEHSFPAGEGTASHSRRDWEMEWQVLEADLAGRISQTELQHLRQLDERAWKSGKRRLYVPTHYAWGRV